ncbi:hypothetical protein JW710_00350 [Candidatus Dojkabacteria bacterium]|nr:hypothetical protein [Candidatus Dojkabacteria bacterium]
MWVAPVAQQVEAAVLEAANTVRHLLWVVVFRGPHLVAGILKGNVTVIVMQVRHHASPVPVRLLQVFLLL